MACFSNLSNELVLEILRNVAPRDLGSACTITKTISLLAAPILEEHRRLRQQFLSINNFCDTEHALVKFLIQILAKPHIAHYVRRLSLYYWCSKWGDMGDLYGFQASTQSQMYPFESKDLQLLRAAVENSKIVRADEVDEWLQAIQNGNEDPVLALLLVHLPNLERFRPFSIGMPIEQTSRTIQQIKHAPAGTYLSHLKNVSINFDRGWEKADMKMFFKSLMSLPSLTSCYVQGLTIDDKERNLEWHLRPHESNIAKLAFILCTIGEKELSEVLESTKHLEAFSYRSLAPPDLSWRGSVGVLHHARHSLEKLTLLPHGDFYTERCSLREFEVLREIDIELALFFSEIESDFQSLPDLLPPSIRIIRLRSRIKPPLSQLGASRELIRIRQAILCIMEVKDVMLPQLSEVHVITHPDERSVFVDTSKACDAQGVSFSLDFPSNYHPA
ncbi:MAG: hypothetical protein ASARMPRED_004607 [Alectoria sarmentosa]|nr:MAG: hypothetical protein ASARMPRED_004607 [Alectoria sarmentosa]